MSNSKPKPKDVKAMLKAAKLPEDSVPICLRGDLQAQFEQAERELAEAEARRKANDSLAGDGSREIAERIESLREQMHENTVDFVFRALHRHAWKALRDRHPPRCKEDGSPDERDMFVGVNLDTIFDELIRSCLVEPVLDEEDWRVLLGDSDEQRARREAGGEPVEDGTLTDRQWNQLADAAWTLNRGEVSVPFSRAASKILHSASE
jgi:hypothetical protein